MAEVFLRIVNMSVTASYCIVAVLPIRFLLRKQPKIYSYLLWSVVLLRLLCPVSFAQGDSFLPTGTKLLSQTSLIERREASPTVWQGKGYLSGEAAHGEMDGEVEMILTASVDEDAMPVDGAEGVQRIFRVCGFLWLAGVIGLLCYSVTLSLRLHLFLRRAPRTAGGAGEDGVCEIDGLSTSFVFGIFRPRIYLPADLQAGERRYVLAHERVHLARKDHLIKAIAWGALCLHWFNPLVWLAYKLMEQDMEMSCDEAVLRQFGSGARCDYSRTLLALACEKRGPEGCFTAFGGGEVRDRVKNILSYRKSPLVTGVLIVLLLGAVALGLFFIPTGDEKGQATAEVSEEKIKFVTDYADAYCERNGNLLVGFYIDEATAIRDVLEMEKVGDTYTYGYSSPWPNEFRFTVGEAAGEDGGTAQIWYYAWTSDPHVAVWKEEMSFIMTAEGFRVTDSELRFLDRIASEADFYEAYRIAGEYRFTDYEERGFVEAVNAQTAYDAQNGGDDRGAAYREPGTAAEWILNLTGGRSEETKNSDAQAMVRYVFGDGSHVDIPMKNANTDGTEKAVWILDLDVWNAGAP